MSARAVAVMAEPSRGARMEIDGRPLSEVAAERSPVICNYCREPIVHDGDEWRHVRTGLSADWRSKECRPLCRECGAPATRAIGGPRFVGSGIAFVIDHFTCARCQSTGALVDHIR